MLTPLHVRRFVGRGLAPLVATFFAFGCARPSAPPPVASAPLAPLPPAELAGEDGRAPGTPLPDAAPVARPVPPAADKVVEAAIDAPAASPAVAPAALGPAVPSPSSAQPLVTRLSRPAVSVAGDEATVRFVTSRACLVDFAGLHVLFSPGDLDRLLPRGRRHRRKESIRLPKGTIDLVAVGRADEGGMSRAVARALWRRYRPTFLVPPGGQARLLGLGIARDHIVEHRPLQPGEALKGATVATLIPSHLPFSRHSLRRGGGAAGYVLARNGRTLYFAGESAFGAQYDEVRSRFGAPDVSILNVVPGADGAIALKERASLSLIEAAHAQAILYSAVAISLPHAERVSHAAAIAPVAGAEAACFITPQGKEVLHIQLGRRGVCEAAPQANRSAERGPPGGAAPSEAARPGASSPAETSAAERDRAADAAVKAP